MTSLRAFAIGHLPPSTTALIEDRHQLLSRSPRGRALRLGGLAWALAALAASAVAGPPSGPRTDSPSGPLADSPPASIALLQRHLLNALLAPALDPEAPAATWVDPRPLLACHASASVRINGQDLVAGQAVPAGRFTLDWQTAGCRPFGLQGPRLDGTARLLLDHDGERWWGTVWPGDVIATLKDGSRFSLAAGPVRMPLASTPGPLVAMDREADRPARPQ